jgi:predicted hydrocarbon binding protein
VGQMTMGKPQVDIQVDDVTGRWSVDALPMILVPQHFFLNNHFAVEAALGPERLSEVLRPAGYRSAYHWCEKEAAHHRLSGLDIFQHYMRRLTQRGWGQFKPYDIDLDAGRARVRIDNSAFVDDERPAGRRVCYMFAAWFEGALEYSASATGRTLSLQAGEMYCVAEGTHDHCMFEISAR